MAIVNFDTSKYKFLTTTSYPLRYYDDYLKESCKILTPNEQIAKEEYCYQIKELEDFAHFDLNTYLDSPKLFCYKAEICCKHAFNRAINKTNTSDMIVSRTSAYALQFFEYNVTRPLDYQDKPPIINQDEKSFFNRCCDKFHNTLTALGASNLLSMESPNKLYVTINFDKLCYEFSRVIREYYQEYPQFLGTKIPNKALQKRILVVINDLATEIERMIAQQINLNNYGI